MQHVGHLCACLKQAACVKEVKGGDLLLMERVSALVGRKALLLSDLKAVNQEALQGRHKQPDGAFSESFQKAYASKILQVRAGACWGPSACSCVDHEGDLVGFRTARSAAAIDGWHNMRDRV
jgi:hypothetical protein